MLHNRF